MRDDGLRRAEQDSHVGDGRDGSGETRPERSDFPTTDLDSTQLLLDSSALRELERSVATDSMDSLRGVSDMALRPTRSVLPRRRRAYRPAEPLEELCWHARYRVEKQLGSGAQGVVYLANREGADGYSTRVALKVYYRDPEVELADYEAEMRRIACQGQRVSRVQHDNLISIRDFVALGETRVMVLEWIDGVDLNVLVSLQSLEKLKQGLGKSDWERLNDVVVTAGRDHCRIKAGIAVDILRGCLAGLAALHHSGIAHCDLKPSNLMIKRSGIKKIIDVDSSHLVSDHATVLRGTPYYMAPEQLQQHRFSLRSDIASLGYILIEMLTGTLLFRDADGLGSLLEAKLRLPERLEEILPDEVRRDPLLPGLVQKMIAVSPEDRFPDADAAEIDRVGAARFHRQLVRTNLSTEYNRELAWWIEHLLGSENASQAGEQGTADGA